MATTLNESELLALIDALADGGWHSGAELARGFGISRAALAKRVDKLREWPLDIESRHGLGHRLARPLERLHAAELQQSLPELRVTVLPSVDSTNACLQAMDPDADPQVLLAEMQTAGRGRRGRRWVSPFGANLYLSLAWSWPRWPRDLSALSLAVGVACARALRALGLHELRLKWPNDLWVRGRKLGGVLIEHRGETGGTCRVIIGIGLNLSMSATQALDVNQDWINLDEALAMCGAKPVGRNALAIALLHALENMLQGYDAMGFAPIAEEWAALDATRDAPVRVFGGSGAFDGIARGLAADGALLVEHDGRIDAVHSGDVSVRAQ